MQKIICKQNIYFFLLIFISIGIGLQLDFYKPAIILLFLEWLFSGAFSEKINRLKKNNFTIALIALYALYGFSILWSANTNLALKDVFLKTPMLLFPLIIVSNKELTERHIINILLAFALSSFAINFYCLIEAFSNYTQNNQWNEFYYQRLTVNMHTAYQALFTCFSLAILVKCFLMCKTIKKWLIYLLVAFQVCFLIMLASRMQILLLAIITPVFFITYFYKKKKLLLGLFYTLFVPFLLVMAAKYSSSPSLKYRYKQTIAYIDNIDVESGNSDPRKFIWQNGLELIKENWFIGVGAGDVKSFLVEKYKKKIVVSPTSDFLVDSLSEEIVKNPKNVMYIQQKAIKNNCTYEEQLNYHVKKILKKTNARKLVSVNREYNFHNQYLQTFGTIGIFGFLIIGYLILAPLLMSIKRGDFLFAAFLFFVGSSFLTESMLERQAGVSFVFYFYSLFIYKFSRNKPS